MIINVN